MTQEQYGKAAEEASKVIGSGAYSLVSNYAAEFHYPIATPTHFDNTSEDIFAIQVTAQSGVNDLNTFYGSADYGGRGDISLKSSFLDEFDADDARLSIYNEDSDGSLRVDKFDNLYGNVRVIRLAEMYLIRAEANLRGSTTTGDLPVNDINVIRTRAHIGDYVLPDDATTPKDIKDAYIAEVVKQRRLELAFEGGFFLHDAKRLKAKVGALEYNSPKLIFPIPSIEINANKNLIQNQGY